MTKRGGPVERDPAAILDTGSRSPGTPIAVSPHYLANRAGIEVMAAGGSAVDAAIAVNAVLGVVLPDTCGIGGDLFAIVLEPGADRPTALNASGRAGAGARAADVRAAGHSEVPLRSPWSVTVPGCVDGWEALHDRYGRLPMSDLLSPAIALAAEGFPASQELSTSLHRIRPLIGTQPSAPPLYPGGEAPDTGSTVARPHLAETLAAIAAAGREALYAGPVGAGIVEATTGMITADDLEQRQAEWVTPLSLDVLGRTGWTLPPNSQGYITLAAALLFEQIAPDRTPTAAAAHALIEAYRAVVSERGAVVSDPDTSPVPPTELLDSARLRPMIDRFDPDRAGVWNPPQQVPGGTAYMCTIDAAGTAVSLIQSNFHGIGSGLSAGATGVFLHNRGAGFCVEDGHPNELMPGRRPLHTLSPTLWTKGGRLDTVLGTRGGDHQPQLLAQVAANLWWHGMDPAEAQGAPRWVSDGWGPGVASRLQVEARMDEGVVAGLGRRGHAVHLASDREAGWGPVAIITATPETVRGVADPRVSTASADAAR